MTHFKLTLAAAATGLAALLAGSAIAEAQPHKVRAVNSARPLTVTGRPFTDTGNIVPVGTEARYVYDSTFFAPNPTLGRAPNSYGAETLPQPFELPNNQPQLRF